MTEPDQQGQADATDEPAGDDGAGTADPTDDSDAEQVDIAAEVGEFHPEGSYVEELEDFDEQPDPPESVVQVLCNLNSTYLSELAALGMSGDGVDMTQAALSLNDNIQVWESLLGHYPDASEDLERAKQVYSYWRQGIAHEDEGDQSSAEEWFNLADAEIAELTAADAGDQVGC